MLVITLVVEKTSVADSPSLTGLALIHHDVASNLAKLCWIAAFTAVFYFTRGSALGRGAFAAAIAAPVFCLLSVGITSNLDAGDDLLVARIEAKYDIDVTTHEIGSRDGRWVVNGVNRDCDSRLVPASPENPVLKCVPVSPRPEQFELPTY